MSRLPAAAAGHNQQPFDVKAVDRAGDKDKDDKDEEDKAGDVEDGASGRGGGLAGAGGGGGALDWQEPVGEEVNYCCDHVGSPVANMLVL